MLKLEIKRIQNGYIVVKIGSSYDETYCKTRQEVLDVVKDYINEDKPSYVLEES